MTKFLTANWENLIMANYEISPEILLPYLPKNLELDYFEDKTYVSLVGFMFRDTRIFGIPIPVLGTFEEVNLRFYVVRTIKGERRRGVVFINETVPNQLVAFIANKLYKEHYTATKTRHNIKFNNTSLSICYRWKSRSLWNEIKVAAVNQAKEIQKNSIDEFIFEHYYGYTRIDAERSMEYKIIHPSWEVYPVLSSEICCDFGEFYGENFRFLNEVKPHSVLLAKGSKVAVNWKRNLI